MKTKKIIPGLRIALSIILPIFLVVGVVYASNFLTPPDGSPTASDYTLDDVYNRIVTNVTATAGNHDLSTTSAPSGADSVFHSISAIYSAIPTIDATKVSTTTTYLGVKGTLLGNIWNGSCDSSSGDGNVVCTRFDESYPGGSQANGGVDDFNGFYQGGTRPSDTYSTSWTTCNLGNTYCGTGDSGANAKDNATGLVWSYPCTGSGCSSWDTSAPDLTDCLPVGDCAYQSSDTTYTWSSDGANNNSLTASQLCSNNLGWSLPHQKQLLQAYIDGSYGNLEPAGAYRYYWSATLVSFDNSAFTQWAWIINLSDGYSYDNRTNGTPHSVRCVR